METWVLIALGFVVWLLVNASLQLANNLKKKSLEKAQAVLARKELEFAQKELFFKYKQEVKQSLDTLLKEKAMGFPWLANAIGDYYENFDKIFAAYLETKPRPAFIQAERVKKAAEEKKIFKKEFLTAKYIIDYYESLFPWLKEYVGFNSEELLQAIYSENNSEVEDPVSFYITKSEFKDLPAVERNQIALNRYWNRDKDPWQIGRDYERFIGYLYEMKGFKVQYHGIEKGKEDLGRDLVCIKGKEIEIVQCKYWSDQKSIQVRENHITQLYGTTIKYFLDHIQDKQAKQNDKDHIFPEIIKEKNIKPVLVTTTALSQTAQEFANVLGIRVDKITMDKNYPCIKCNVNNQTNERIYHLPFDQQYDKTMINSNTEERWVKTAQEAEKLGFRRAWRWKGNE
jgi:hypothetical protein